MASCKRGVFQLSRSSSFFAIFFLVSDLSYVSDKQWQTTTSQEVQDIMAHLCAVLSLKKLPFFVTSCLACFRISRFAGF